MAEQTAACTAQTLAHSRFVKGSVRSFYTSPSSSSRFDSTSSSAFCSRLATCVPVPRFNSAPIHFKFIAVSVRRRRAIHIFPKSPLARPANSLPVQARLSSSSFRIRSAFSSVVSQRSSRHRAAHGELEGAEFVPLEGMIQARRSSARRISAVIQNTASATPSRRKTRTNHGQTWRTCAGAGGGAVSISPASIRGELAKLNRQIASGEATLDLAAKWFSFPAEHYA